MSARSGSTENYHLEIDDAELAELAADLGERLRRGETFDLADYDGRVDQLRELLADDPDDGKTPLPGDADREHGLSWRLSARA